MPIFEPLYLRETLEIDANSSSEVGFQLSQPIGSGYHGQSRAGKVSAVDASRSIGAARRAKADLRRLLRRSDPDPVDLLLEAFP